MSNFDMTDVVDAEFEEIKDTVSTNPDIDSVELSKWESGELGNLHNAEIAQNVEMTPEQMAFAEQFKAEMARRMAIKPNRKQRRDMAKKSSDKRIRNSKRR